jgi:hypothetical protein
MRAGRLGFIDTPKQGNRRPAGIDWCADNGCYSTGWPGETAWFAWLTRHAVDAATCAFAVAPDIVADADATLTRSLPWLPRIRALGYPAAFVAQDGLTSEATPWPHFDVLFIGGSTGFKMGSAARTLAAEAIRRGIPVHMGRVNSQRRYSYARLIGCTSVDGTILAMFPDRRLPEVLAWLRSADQLTLQG